MLSIVKVNGTFIKNALRFVKVLIFGKGATPKQVGPFGIDSVPPKDWVAVMANTNSNEERVILGYFNKKLMDIEEGETLVFSVTSGGALASYIRLKKTSGAGEMELAGNANNLVKYAALNTALQNDIVTYFTTELATIATAIGTAGGSYTPSPITVDISGAKVDEIKCP